MAAIDFPDNPYEGQIYSQNGKSWKWDGVSWVSYNTPVDYHNIIEVDGVYPITRKDSLTVLLSGVDGRAAYVVLSEENDAEIDPGFRVELWRVSDPVCFEASDGIEVIAPEGLWVSKAGGRAVVMKIGTRKWLLHGDLVPTPAEEVIQTESGEPIMTDNT